MKNRSKSAKKSSAGRRRAPRARKAPGRTLNLSVKPIAMKAGAAGADAVIPVSVKQEGNSAHALIPVEVATGGEAPKKRAAVIPIAVQNRSARARRRKKRSHAAKPRQRQIASAPEQARGAYPMPWRRFFAKGMNGVLDVEENAIRLGVEYGLTAVTAVRSVLWPILGRPAVARVSEPGELLPWSAGAATNSGLRRAA